MSSIEDTEKIKEDIAMTKESDKVVNMLLLFVLTLASVL